MIAGLQEEIKSLTAVNRGLSKQVDAVTTDAFGLPQRAAALESEWRRSPAVVA